MKKIVVGAFCLALCAGAMVGCSDDPVQPVTQNNTSPGLPNGPPTLQQVLVGRDIVTTAGCGDCHNRGTTNPNDPNWLAGYINNATVNPSNGGRFSIANNTVFARNLTPDASGLGSWSYAQIFDALRKGKDDQGKFLCPPMPWPEYQNMTDDDIWSVVAYLKSIKAVNNAVPENTNPQGGPLDSSVFFPTVPPAVPNYPAANEVEVTNLDGPGLPNGQATRTQTLRGRYLVTARNDCNACHSVGGNNPANPNYLAGFVANATVNPTRTGQFQIGPVTTFARNLTPDPATGLGNFTSAQIFSAIRDGVDPRNQSILKPPMPWTAFHNLKDEDVWAIVAYLKSVKPVSNAVPADVVPPGFPGFNTTSIPLPAYPGSNEIQ